MASTPNYPSDVKNIAKTILPADTTAWVDLYDNSAGAKAVRIESLTICSDDTSTVNISFGLYKGSTTYLMGTARVVTLSGTDGAAAAVQALGTGVVGNISADGTWIVEIEAGAKLQAKSLATVTTAKTVTITGRVRKYE